MKKQLLLIALLFSFLANNSVTKACYTSFGYQLQPIATPAIYPPLPIKGGTVAFYAKADGIASEWQWDFGDGSTSKEQNPIHLFTENKTYKVTPAFIDKCVATHEDSLTFPQLQPCWLDFNYNTVMTFADCKCAGIYSFKANAESEIVSYNWSFGDSTYSTDATPVHTFNKNGTYWVNLLAITAAGCKTNVLKQIDLDTTSCNFTIGINGSSNPYTFSYLSIYSNLTGKKVNWDFGDGTVGYGFSSKHSYINPGYYKICATLFDNNGDVCKQCTTAYFSGTNIDTCNMKGIFYNSYKECKIPVIKTDSALYVVTNGYNFSMSDSTKINFGFKPDPSKRMSLICGNVPTQNIILTCVTILDKPTPADSTCHENGTYWGKYLDCTYPVIKTEQGAYLVIGGQKPTIPNGTPIVFGYIQNYDKILYTNCIDYNKAITLTCVSAPYIDSTATCSFKGTVRDYTGLDGCGYVIELDNGIKLEPVLNKVTFSFYDKQRVKLALKEVKTASICMVGKMAEITCIEEIFDTKPDPCNFFISLNTSGTIGNNNCTGQASAYAYSPINMWKEIVSSGTGIDTIPVQYSYQWSNGQSGNIATNLCPNQVYWLTVTDSDNGCAITSSFSIFKSSTINTAWTYQQVDSFYYFSLPTSPSNKVVWTFNDGTVREGATTSYPAGNAKTVTLSLKDENGNEIYSEVIDLQNTTNINQTLNSTEKVLVFPIPTRNVLTISYSANQYQKATLEIRNIIGQIVYTQNITTIDGKNSLTFDVSTLHSGVYVGTIYLNNKQLHFKLKKQ